MPATRRNPTASAPAAPAPRGRPTPRGRQAPRGRPAAGGRRGRSTTAPAPANDGPAPAQEEAEPAGWRDEMAARERAVQDREDAVARAAPAAAAPAPGPGMLEAIGANAGSYTGGFSFPRDISIDFSWVDEGLLAEALEGRFDPHHLHLLLEKPAGHALASATPLEKLCVGIPGPEFFLRALSVLMTLVCWKAGDEAAGVVRGMTWFGDFVCERSRSCPWPLAMEIFVAHARPLLRGVRQGPEWKNPDAVLLSRLNNAVARPPPPSFAPAPAFAPGFGAPPPAYGAPPSAYGLPPPAYAPAAPAYHSAAPRAPAFPPAFPAAPRSHYPPPPPPAGPSAGFGYASRPATCNNWNKLEKGCAGSCGRIHQCGLCGGRDHPKYQCRGV